jgi:adenylate kinase family enzyme
MNKYQNGKVYKITSLNTTDIYIGSTTHRLLCQRFSKHNNCYKYWLKDNNKGYCSSYEILKHGDCKIELLELYPCSCIDELNKCEGKYQRDIDCVNNNIAGRTIKEWKEDNKEAYKEYQKKWNEDNAVIIAGYQKDYRKNNAVKISNYKKEIIKCECGCDIKYSYKSQHLKTEKHKINLIKFNST